MRPGEAGSAEVEADASRSEAGTSKAETLLAAPEGDPGAPKYGSRYLYPAPRSWADAPVPPQGCTTPEEELQMWKTEYLHQLQFIYHLSRKLASKGISVIVDTLPSVRPDVHRKLLDVVKVIAPIFGGRPESFREHVNGAENEPQLTRVQLALEHTLQPGLALTDKLDRDSGKPRYDPRNLDNVRQLFPKRASSFGEDLRQSWDKVLGLLSERQFGPRERSSYMRGFMIFQDLDNNGASAAVPKLPVKRLLKERVYDDTAGTTDCTALLMEAAQNVVATRQIRHFHADLVARAPLRQHQAAPARMRRVAKMLVTGVVASSRSAKEHECTSLRDTVQVLALNRQAIAELATALVATEPQAWMDPWQELARKTPMASEPRGGLDESHETKHYPGLNNALRRCNNTQEEEAVVKLKQAVADILSEAELHIWPDTETAARRKMVRICDLRSAPRTKVATLEQKVGEAEETLPREKETVADLRQKVEHMENKDRGVLEGISMASDREKDTVSKLQDELYKTCKNRADIIRKLKQGFDANVATPEEKVGEGQRALARKHENVAGLEQQAEDLSNHNNALEVQLANQAQPTAVGTGRPTSLVRPRSNTAIAAQLYMVSDLVISKSSPVHSPGAPLTSTPSPAYIGYHVGTMDEQLHSMVTRNLTRHFECVLEMQIAQEHMPTNSPPPSTDAWKYHQNRPECLPRILCTTVNLSSTPRRRSLIA
ncbi:hypothetical protein DL762_008623 [Monosporascus cannonballus]|uniref:Uncharacterized protein n=1 Tax=Monosporascus cannonballus TaxID=155416 RepID=A0ABY0H060_9PEZI|nr:hypothetical protein DL762_008623 [Monosporascus cannonballus]